MTGVPSDKITWCLVPPAFLIRLGAECATINGASIKAGSMHFPKGEISCMCQKCRGKLAVSGARKTLTHDFLRATYSDQQLQECLPFPTKMVVVDMEGEVLQEAVRFSRANGAYDAEKRGL